MKITTLGSNLAAVAAVAGVEMRTSPFIQEAEAISVIEATDDFDGTLLIQTSDDNAAWTTVITFLGVPLTGVLTQLDQVTMKAYMRANVTVLVAGKVSAKLLA